MANPTFTTVVVRTSGSVKFDSLPAEEKKRLAEGYNRTAVETVAISEGYKANFIKKGTA